VKGRGVQGRRRYRCRLCGAVTDSAASSFVSAAQLRHDELNQFTKAHRESVPLITEHDCADGNLGVADLLGVIVTDEPVFPRQGICGW
jgi:hypothetical protein